MSQDEVVESPDVPLIPSRSRRLSPQRPRAPSGLLGLGDEDENFLSLVERFGVLSTLMWCLVVAAIVVATQPSVEHAAFGDKSSVDLSPGGAGGRSKGPAAAAVAPTTPAPFHRRHGPSTPASRVPHPRGAVSVSLDARRRGDDPAMPGFHFVPWPSDWMNDPNGPFYDPVTKQARAPALCPRRPRP